MNFETWNLKISSAVQLKFNSIIYNLQIIYYFNFLSISLPDSMLKLHLDQDF